MPVPSEVTYWTPFPLGSSTWIRPLAVSATSTLWVPGSTAMLPGDWNCPLPGPVAPKKSPGMNVGVDVTAWAEDADSTDKAAIADMRATLRRREARPIGMTLTLIRPSNPLL